MVWTVAVSYLTYRSKKIASLNDCLTQMFLKHKINLHFRISKRLVLFLRLLAELLADSEHELIDSVLHVDDTNLHPDKARLIKLAGNQSNFKCISYRQKVENI